MRPNLITRLKEEWNNLDPVDPLRGLIADAIEALAEQPAISAGPITPAMMQGPTPEQKAQMVEVMSKLAEQPAQQQNSIEPIEFLSGFLTERLAIERGIEWTPAIHDLCNRAIEEEKLAEQPAQQQEPVLWQILNGVCHAGVRSTENLAREAAAGMQKAHDLGGSLAAFHVRPLYTSPPASKPWVGLTTDDRKQLLHDHHPDIDPVAFFAAIDAKYREKNAS